MNSASCLLVLLEFAAWSCYVSAGKYYPRTLDIATVVCGADILANASSSLDEEAVERLDMVLVSNDSVANTWVDEVDGYASAADSKIVYQTAKWSLLEDGSQEGKSPMSFWARFEAVNATALGASYLSVCTMVTEWNSSWKENKSVLAAVDVMNNLTDKCGENDTIAVAFTSAVSGTVSSYLEGEIAVNDAVSPFKMYDVDSSTIPEVSDRLFVRLAGGLCPRDESAMRLSSLSDTEAPFFTLFRGEVCIPMYDPQAPSKNVGNKNESGGWHHDLRFIIPVGVCVFLLGCIGLIYMLRQKKEAATTAATETPKEAEKDDPPSLPYVLTMHPI